MTSPVTVHVPLGDRAYDVHIGAFDAQAAADCLAAALPKATGLAVLVDRTVRERSPRVAPLVEALRARLPVVRQLDLAPGESCKTLSEVGRTCEWLAGQGFDRGAALLGIGGGAATDHTGFAAAIYLRGVAFASVSTTVLGMVDASVGGKTGVDLPAGKNLVGAFHQPAVVLADLGFLDTLPAREQSAGLAEAVKAGLIADATLFRTIELEVEAGRAFSRDSLAAVIAAAVRVKVDIVTEDERESGRRAILNFGHTVGHAIEAASGDAASGFGLLHGEAVALGMIAALALGEARGVTDPALRPRTTALLRALQLPTDVEDRVGDDVLRRIEVDKKRRSDSVRFVFVRGLGESTLQDVALPDVGPAVRHALGR